MTGLTPFSIEKSEFFQRALKKLIKSYNKALQKSLVILLANILEELIQYPYPQNSRQEPTPKKVKSPNCWKFYKLEFKLAKGASGQIRLMYLVNEKEKIIKPLWIYSHEQFAKRPSDGDISNAIKNIIDC